MKDKNDRPIRQGDKVQISDNMVKKLQLPTRFGIVTDARHNTRSLVSVKIQNWTPVDFHAKSLQVQE